MRINEIFYSLQGEGRHAGVPSVFIRFSGCNLKCPFCDTRHEGGTIMTENAIIAEVRKYPAEWIILTGGEPSLHITTEFIGKLKEETGRKIAIETNGTTPLPPGIDWVTLSPKFGMGGALSAGADEVRIDHADEIKVVDLGQDLEPYFALRCRSAATLMYLQPCFVSDRAECETNRLRTVGRVLSDPRWTLSVQLHRYLNIP